MSNLSGQTFGKYELLGRIGRGGMADVYQAYQPGFDRHVAIKMIHDHMVDDETFVERFRREAQAVAQLRHPHILQVIDFDVQDDVYYMVMEYIQGGTLKSYITENGPSQPEFALKIIAQIADALHYAHEKGMVHRDIKSANIMFTDVDHQQAVLTDFGIARMINSSVLTSSGMIVGTPLYLSPESGLGQPTDRRSDIYGLGIVLYEMLTGDVPFRADTPYAIIMKHIGEPLPLELDDVQLPDIVEMVLLRATQKDPADRYETAADFSAALKDARQTLLGNAPKAPRRVRQQAVPIRSDYTQFAPEKPKRSKTPDEKPKRKSIPHLLPTMAAGTGILALLGFGLWLLMGQSNTSAVMPAVPTVTASQVADNSTVLPESPASTTRDNNPAPPPPRPGRAATLKEEFGDRLPLNFMSDSPLLTVPIGEIQNDAEALYNLARLAFENGQTRFVPPLMTRALTIDEQPEYHVLLGDGHLAQGNAIQAIESYTDAIELDPTWADAYLSRGLVYDEDGDIPSAVNDFKLAVKLMPDNPDAFYYLARAQFNLPVVPYDDVLGNLQNAILLNPVNPIYHASVGLVHSELEEWNDAIEAFTTAIRFAPRDPNNYYDRAIAYFQIDALDKALSDVEDALQRGIELDVEEYIQLAETYAGLQDYEEAAFYYNQALTDDPTRTDLFVPLITALTAAQQYEDAVAIADEALRINIGDPELFRLKADALYEMGEIYEASEVYETIETILGDDTPDYVLERVEEGEAYDDD